MTAERRHNLLVLSDVHLGSDLVQHVRPDAPRRTRVSERRDRDLAALFDYYRENRAGGVPWRLVINGDFVDFAGMSVMGEPGEIQTEPTDEERSHGLGGAPDHTLAKLRLVMEHHATVMQRLAEFLAAGNSLVIVRGNHDIDWHWRSVQREFRRCLMLLAPIAHEQITFAPWFYYEEGLVYVEHGHQYDELCSYEHVLYPVLPSDPRRTARSLSDVLLRYVVKPTRGMMEAGHDVLSLFDYVRFAVRLGAGGMLSLARRFVSANRALFAAWWESVSGAAGWVRREHERRMRRLSAAYRIKLERLQGLAGLQHPPVTRSLRATMTSVMLDRILAGGVSVAGSTVLFATVAWPVALAGSALLALGLWLILRAWLRHRTLEPSAMLRESSARVAKLFPAAFVVMGHTHLPEMARAAELTTYVNLGAWAEEETPDGAPGALPATRTHFVLVNDDGHVRAELRAWEGDGPKPFGAKAP